jgi:hypothetical protein
MLVNSSQDMSFSGSSSSKVRGTGSAEKIAAVRDFEVDAYRRSFDEDG